MCGIVGLAYRDGRKPDPDLLKNMLNTLVHRGPDGDGIVVLDGCGLGHRRLAIIDLKSGAQPLANEDESIWVTFNGEIYNFRELRKLLEGKNHRFRTESDTESIVHLYEERGPNLVESLRGMFAFGIWDARKRSLILARDRIGKKPVYWFEDKEGIYFASEIKALLQLPHCPREIDFESIDLYLTYQSVQGTKTIFRGIHRLAPASYLTWTGRSPITIEKYWVPDWTKKTQLSYQDAKEHLRELVRDATRARLISDVPLGAFLSGGVDSSIVVSAMAELSDMPVKTFTIGFPQSDFTETKFAKMVAEKFGTDHEEFIVEPSATDILPKLVWHYDQPFGDPASLPTYYLSKMAREHVTVALNGEGGDEFWGGYEAYRASVYHQIYSKLTNQNIRNLLASLVSGLSEGATKESIKGKIKRFLNASCSSTENCHLRLTQVFSGSARADLYSPDFLSELDGYQGDSYLLNLMQGDGESGLIGDVIDRVLRGDTLAFLPDTLLTKVDIATMAVSLEGRSPLLDTSVMEFAASLPSKWKVGIFALKRIVKEAYEGILPHEILYRPKMGFNVPLTHWFRGELFEFIREVLCDQGCRSRTYFNQKAIERLIEDHKRGVRDNATRLWVLMMLELWHKEFSPTT